MPRPLDLRAFAAALPEQNLSPRSLKATVCGSITTAVAAFAQASPNARYTIDPAVLQRVVGDYLEAHPTHNKPLNLMVTELDDTCRVDYYEMCYGTDSSGQGGKFEFIPQLGRRELVEGQSRDIAGIVNIGKMHYVEEAKAICIKSGRLIFPDGQVDESPEFRYIGQLNLICMTSGKRTMPNGDIYSGTFAYVPGMDKNSQLVKGRLTYSTGRSETGEFAYIPQLNSMKLVKGTTKNAEGEVVKEGRREYVPQKNGMMLIEGLSVFSDGTRQEGTRSYVPELNEVVLTAGSITQGNKVQTGTWAYSQFENKMVFTAEQPKPKLPQYVRNQIQSAVQELVNIQHRFDSSGQFNTSAAILNTIAEQAEMAQNPLQYNAALQTFNAQYKTLTRELSLLTHPDKVETYSANIHGAALQQLASLRESIDGQVNRWKLATVDWS